MKRWALFAGFLLLFPNLLAPQGGDKVAHEGLKLETEREVRALSNRFASILAPTVRARQLQTACSHNCSAPANDRDGITVAEELERLDAANQAELDQVSAEIQRLISEYIVRSVSTSSPNLDRDSIRSDLRQILPSDDIAGIQSPSVFFTQLAQWAPSYLVLRIVERHHGCAVYIDSP